MRILTLHNRYRQRGGEDESTESEIRLLQERGHEVLAYVEDNHAFGQSDLWQVGLRAVWNGRSYKRVRELIQSFLPDVIKIHNFFPLLSPSVICAAGHEGVPVVQALHNFRLLCPAATFYRADAPCESCLGKSFGWPALLYGCYKDSRPATAAVTVMNASHAAAGTWARRVSMYVAPSEFTRQKFVEAGFPANKIKVKPNFLSQDPGIGDGKGGFALFAGRLSAEKGLGTLFQAWKRLSRPVPLKIAGGGPLQKEVEKRAKTLRDIELLGEQSNDSVWRLMGQAAVTVVPSECYETFGRVVIEAFAKGLPVIASDRGALPELVEHGRTGLLFRAGDPEDLAAKVDWFLSHPAEAARMRKEARAEYLAKYTAEKNYQALMEIYESVLAEKQPGRRAVSAAARAAGHAG